MNCLPRFGPLWNAPLTLAVACLVISASSYAQDKSDEPLAITHGPYLQAPSASSMAIVWFTNKKCVAQVEYGPLDSFADTATRKTARTEVDGLLAANQTRHVVTLRGLVPGKAYGYRIQAKEILAFKPYQVTYGNTVTMDRMNDTPLGFVTFDPTKPRCSFSVVCDVHQHAGQLAKMLEQVPWNSTDFFVFNGDTLNFFDSEKQVFGGFLDECVRRFAARIPLVYVRGNHETRGAMARQLLDYFPTPAGRYYYHFQQGPVRILVLDSGEDKSDDHAEYSGLVDFDAYRAREAEWLKEAIAEPEFQQSPYRIVLMHMPLVGSGGYGVEENRELLLPLLNKAGINLALSGHTHAYAKIDAGQQENRFPIIIGSPQEIVRVDATADELSVVVQNADGSLKDQLHLPKATKFP